MQVVDVYEPKQAGLPKLEETRVIAAYDCILSKTPLDKKESGYQEPEPKDESY